MIDPDYHEDLGLLILIGNCGVSRPWGKGQFQKLWPNKGKTTKGSDPSGMTVMPPGKPMKSVQFLTKDNENPEGIRRREMMSTNESLGLVAVERVYLVPLGLSDHVSSHGALLNLSGAGGSLRPSCTVLYIPYPTLISDFSHNCGEESSRQSHIHLAWVAAYLKSRNLSAFCFQSFPRGNGRLPD